MRIQGRGPRPAWLKVQRKRSYGLSASACFPFGNAVHMYAARGISDCQAELPGVDADCCQPI